jgi:hypothetical protein
MIKDYMKEVGQEKAMLFFHIYATPKEEKLLEMEKVYRAWGFDPPPREGGCAFKSEVPCVAL